MDIYNNFFDEQINLFPSLNEHLNLDDYRYLNNQLENDLDSKHIQQQKKLYNKYLDLMNKKKNLSIYDKTLLYLCKNCLESHKYNYHLTPINHQNNFITYFMENASGNGSNLFNKIVDYDNFIEKITIYPEIVTCIIKNMTIGITKKYTLPKIIVEYLIEQLTNSIKHKTYLNKNIKYKLKYDFNKLCDTIFTESTKKLIHFLDNTYKPRCRNTIGMCDLPNGKNEYIYLVKSTLTLDNVSINEIHEYGKSEVERIFNLMMKVKNDLNFNSTDNLKNFNKYLHNHKSLQFKNKEDLLKTYRKCYKNIDNTIMQTNFHNNVKNKCLIIPVPKYNEKYSPEAYYMPGDIQNKRNGKFYINLRNIKDNSKLEVESLTLHEVNPGHHYQLTYVNEKKDIPLFIKSYSNTSYEEGWALYCENLGSYKDITSYYGKLILEMVRALRLVVDTGIHYYGWSYEKTFDYYKKYSFDSNIQIKNQLLRYIAIPSQALAYKMGEKIILDLKKKYKGNVKDFHEKILENGAIPMFLLKEKIQRNSK